MRTADDTDVPLPSRSERGRPVALLLPGQGAQHEQMAAGLYGSEPVFTAAMDLVFGELGEPGERLRADWLSDRPLVPIEHVTRSQPLLFAIDHALGRLVLSWGSDLRCCSGTVSVRWLRPRWPGSSTSAPPRD